MSNTSELREAIETLAYEHCESGFKYSDPHDIGVDYGAVDKIMALVVAHEAASVQAAKYKEAQYWAKRLAELQPKEGAKK